MQAHERHVEEVTHAAGPDPQEALNEFVYTVSHDLGAPLRAVVNFSKMLEKHIAATLDEKGQKYLDFITDGGEKAQAMLQALLMYSRLNTQTQPHAFVNSNALMTHCHQSLRPRIVANRALLHTSELPPVLGDEQQIGRLFHVLLENALTYFSPDREPHIWISGECQDNQVTFRIRDNGIGIPPEYAERVFDIFKRLHTDEEYPGIGMGLALAKKIVELHGGKIGIEQKTGDDGATVWFTLPAATPQGAM